MLLDYSSLATAPHNKCIYSSGWVGAFATAAKLYGRNKIDPLIHRFSDLEFDGPKDPLKILYKFLQKSKTQNSNSVRRVVFSQVSYPAAVAAIKACLEGREISKIRITKKTEFKNVEEYRRVERARVKAFDV